MTDFTPISALTGGILIGLSASLLLLFTGRIAGISGIAGGLLSPVKGDIAWRACFISGLIFGGLLISLTRPESVHFTISAPWIIVITAGFLVGYGTRLANGCTSGHGVCGIARFSLRSLVATGCFILAGMVTVYVVRHLVGGFA